MANTRTDEEKVKDVTNRLGQLERVRQNFETIIDNAITYVNHGILKISDKDGTKGKKTGIEVYDDTAIRANNLRAMGLHGYLFSPGWFKHELSNTLEFPRTSGMRGWNGKRLDELPEVAEWLSASQEVMYAAFSSSNWYQITTEVFRMGGAAGTVPIYVEKDMQRDRLCFTPVHIRECYLSRNRFNEVDAVYRKYKVTLKSLVGKFGEDVLVKADANFKNAFENNPYEEREILHATFEREGRDRQMVDAKNKPWASLWIWNSKLLLESGYDFFPWIIYDERLNSNEWYSRSPGMDAIVAILLANQQGLTNLKAGHRAADPPYAMLESLRGRANLNPAGRTYLQNMEQAPQIMDSNLRGLPIGIEFQERTDRVIDEYFHTDVFLMMNRIAMENKNLTATQVVEMTGEKAAVLSSDTERIEYGMFNPTIDIVFDLEYDASPDGYPMGRIPAPPDIIFEMGITKLDTNYQGPLSQARKRFYKAQGIKAGIEDVAMIAQLDPTVLRIPNWHKITRYVTKESFPSDCMNSEDAVKQAIEMEQQQIAAQQASAGVIELAKAVPMGKEVEGGSPLSLLGKVMGGSQQ